MVTLIFLRVLLGYIWVNILSTPRKYLIRVIFLSLCQPFILAQYSSQTETGNYEKGLYPCSTELLAHPSLVGSKVYFFWSPTEDYCVTVWWIWFVFVDYQVSVWRVGRDLMRRKCPNDGTKCRSDTDLIVDKHKSDSSDCDTIVFRRWPEEINLASDEWRMSQKLCGTGVSCIHWKLPLQVLTVTRVTVRDERTCIGALLPDPFLCLMVSSDWSRVLIR